MITHWQNILKGKRMSKRNITFIIMIITLLTLPLSACGKNKNNISTDNSQKLQSESGQEYDDGRDVHMIPAGESQTNDESQTNGESQKTGEKKNVQENASDAQYNNINSELPPVALRLIRILQELTILPEQTVPVQKTIKRKTQRQIR